ncbi:FAD-dependent oxidoreductase [Tunturiibacter empetritectus]|uniref:Thioredoxin reductase (NADPH) n=1 Tax=Tunturiibacter lichenicola TaxID=2051959 RepID=A0A852VCG7_9BACT|nr:FAD-dependent oxidoreductase [Edaphobacter lichenicola]NYF87975.1 thioredoxin reductase (NADPH) [Edaphobacter lichenicola]
MITTDELKDLPLFESLSDEWRRMIAESAAELSVPAGEWIVREGETPSFFVLLEGSLTCEKDYGGTNKVSAPYAPGDFYGEIPILLDSVAIASLKSTAPSRLLRLDRVQFKDMIASSPRCNQIVVEVMTRRLKMIQNHMQTNDSLRVRVVGSQYSTECRDVRDFLSQNHISYRWSDHDETNPIIPDSCGEAYVVVDQSKVVSCPLTVRKVAQALGMRTAPEQTAYDVVIIGGGPAGLAAAVSGASEGLKVLLLEKKGIGGQAACSSRIENYPGFPTGISGNELASKALKQAVHFGAEIVVTREVHQILTMDGEYCIEMDGGYRVQAKSILLATGVQWRTLSVPGMKPLIGRGVLYGAARTEAHTVLGKNIFIVGAGNSAGQAAMFFSGYACSVTLLVRGRDIRNSMSQYLVDQLRSRTNIYIETSTEVSSVSGDTHLDSICTESSGQVKQRQADALFVMIGACAASAWMPDELQRDPNGFVLTGRDATPARGARTPFLLESNLPGIFCAGDIRHDSVKRVSSGMGEGSMAIAFVHQYLALQTETVAALI